MVADAKGVKDKQLLVLKETTMKLTRDRWILCLTQPITLPDKHVCAINVDSLDIYRHEDYSSLPFILLCGVPCVRD